MDRQDHIVTRVPVAPVRRQAGEGRQDAEVVGAWLWPTTGTPDDQAGEADEPTAIEVSLLPQTRRLLRGFPAAGLERPYVRHLEQRILRHPRDLLSHVRRLFHARSLRDSDAIAGALADLFLVLGKHGRQLRSRLLEYVEQELPPSQRRFFESHLEVGLDATEPMPDIAQSRLSKSVRGTTRIVVRANDSRGVDDRPVQLAKESITRGQYDVARAVLEGALESDPGDKEVCAELLNLYRHRNLRSGFFKTYTAMLGRQLAFPERWARLATDFESGAVSNV